VIIAQISDTHIALDTPDADQRIDDFERTIADINALDPAPNVIIHTGDVVHNGKSSEYAVAAKILAKAIAKTFVMVGNKDDRKNLHAEFSSAGYLASDPDFVTYAIEDFPVRLIALDTLNPGSSKGNFCEDRVTRLIDMVDAEPTKPIAVFAHHPPFMVPEGPEPLHFETDVIMHRFREALRHSGRVIGVYCGHVHRGVSGFVEDIPVSVMPCIATTLRKGDYSPHMAACPIYHIHRYYPKWGFSTEARIVNKL